MPTKVFRSSKTPAGFFARQLRLEEAEIGQWKIDRRETVAALLAGQLPDGSWSRSSIETIKCLFGLHPTVRSTIARRDATLTWQLKKIIWDHKLYYYQTPNALAQLELLQAE